ncbi:MAG TPA: DUF167 domain-containing protein [Casimicrobiaceae bacterium]|nr:DUF167 domain-containing protein [Casimicrobiaceae bacterium]
MPKFSADSPNAPAWRSVSADGSITLQIHAQPRAGRTEIAGVHNGCLKIRLAAPAVDGKANQALIAFLAASFRVPRRNVSVLRGESGRRKAIRIASPTARPDRDWAL